MMRAEAGEEAATLLNAYQQAARRDVNYRLNQRRRALRTMFGVVGAVALLVGSIAVVDVFAVNNGDVESTTLDVRAGTDQPVAMEQQFGWGIIGSSWCSVRCMLSSDKEKCKEDHGCNPASNEGETTGGSGSGSGAMNATVGEDGIYVPAGKGDSSKSGGKPMVGDSSKSGGKPTVGDKEKPPAQPANLPTGGAANPPPRPANAPAGATTTSAGAAVNTPVGAAAATTSTGGVAKPPTGGAATTSTGATGATTSTGAAANTPAGAAAATTSTGGAAKPPSGGTATTSTGATANARAGAAPAGAGANPPPPPPAGAQGAAAMPVGGAQVSNNEA